MGNLDSPRYPSDYEYIGRTYGIRPRYGERVRERHHDGSPNPNGRIGTVVRERKSDGARVYADFGFKFPLNFHPNDLEYLDREAT
jgi:hypothetical protein